MANRGGFSWKRAVGITKQKQRISRATGIPLSKSGRQRKIGKLMTGGCVTFPAALVILVVVVTLIVAVSGCGGGPTDNSVEPVSQEAPVFSSPSTTVAPRATTSTEPPTTTTQAPTTTIGSTTTIVSSVQVTVYGTKTGEKYHRESCSSLRKSKIPMTLDEAKAKGLEPCKICDPPV